MGELTRNFNWPGTHLGPPEQWPQNLRLTLSMILSSRFPMFLWWGEELIQFYNDAYRPSLGNNGKHPAVGQKAKDCWPEIWDIIYPLINQVRTTGQATWSEDQLVPIYRNGRIEDVYWTFGYSPIFSETGLVEGVLVVCTETTEKVQTIQALVQSERNLHIGRHQMEKNQAELLEIKKYLELELEADRQLQRQKDDFIGIASHELKTPLTTLSAITQVLKTKLQNTDDVFISNALDKANSQVKKMSSLINGFLNISRLESGKILIEKQRFELNQLIQEMIDEIQMVSQNHTIISFGCEDVEVFADRDKVSSVISNLLSNAVKYSPKGKNIELRCMVNNGFAQVSIKDEGMGVKEKDLDKLFDRYYRVESNHTKYISGFGIGLYLSAEIIKQHDGRIWVESESGVGSTFHFTLPLAE